MSGARTKKRASDAASRTYPTALDKKGGLFLGAAKESDEGDAGIQGIGSAVVDVMPSDYFELITRQASGATKNVTADKLTWCAIKVVEQEGATKAAGS